MQSIIALIIEDGKKCMTKMSQNRFPSFLIFQKIATFSLFVKMKSFLLFWVQNIYFINIFEYKYEFQLSSGVLKMI